MVDFRYVLTCPWVSALFPEFQHYEVQNKEKTIVLWKESFLVSAMGSHRGSPGACRKQWEDLPWGSKLGAHLILVQISSLFNYR